MDKFRAEEDAVKWETLKLSIKLFLLPGYLVPLFFLPVPYGKCRFRITANGLRPVQVGN
jgi:hypothetical protein